MQALGEHYLATVRARFTDTKRLADRAAAQLTDAELHDAPDPASNSVAVTMKHIAGNQLSRWTDFLTSDGEKAWRNRDAEFVDGARTRAEVLRHWEDGWQALFGALDELTPAHLAQDIIIRSEPQSVLAAIERQVAHYSYHVGQIVYLARLIKGDAWQTLSIPRGGSAGFNAEMGHGADA